MSNVRPDPDVRLPLLPADQNDEEAASRSKTLAINLTVRRKLLPNSKANRFDGSVIGKNINKLIVAAVKKILINYSLSDADSSKLNKFAIIILFSLFQSLEIVSATSFD